MKKTLIASAIAATLSAGASATDNASPGLAASSDTMLDIYGNINLVHVSESTNTGLPGAQDLNVNEMKDNLSTIGFRQSHQISEGVEGFFKAEFEYNGDNKNEGSGIDKLDEAYVGIRGDFGAIQIGSDDTVYEWADMVDTDEYVGLIDSEIAADQEGDNIQYVSPEIAEGLVLGVTAPTDSDTTFGGALAAKYVMDNLNVVLAYSLGREEGLAEDGDTLALAASYTINDLMLIGQYETKDSVKNLKDGKDFAAAQAIYNMGVNTFVFGYGMTMYDNNNLEDTSTFYLQALHNFSEQMYTYLEFTDSQNVDGVDDKERQILAVGAAYNF